MQLLVLLLIMTLYCYIISALIRHLMTLTFVKLEPSRWISFWDTESQIVTVESNSCCMELCPSQYLQNRVR